MAHSGLYTLPPVNSMALIPQTLGPVSFRVWQNHSDATMSAVTLLLTSEQGPNVLQGGSPSWGLSWTGWRPWAEVSGFCLCLWNFPHKYKRFGEIFAFDSIDMERL